MLEKKLVTKAMTRDELIETKSKVEELYGVYGLATEREQLTIDDTYFIIRDVIDTATIYHHYSNDISKIDINEAIFEDSISYYLFKICLYEASV